MSKNSPAFEAAAAAQKSLQKIETSTNNVVAYHISGTLGQADYDFINAEMKAVLDKGDQLMLYLEYVNITGTPLASVWEDFKENIVHYQSLRKLAFVSEESPLEWLSDNDPSMLNFEPRHFSVGQREVALQWLSK